MMKWLDGKLDGEREGMNGDGWPQRRGANAPTNALRPQSRGQKEEGGGGWSRQSSKKSTVSQAALLPN